MSILGNGDGTFRPATSITAGKHATRIAGDFNSDGKSDLIVVRTGDTGLSDNGATIFLGNGDGTFSPGEMLPPLFITFHAANEIIVGRIGNGFSEFTQSSGRERSM